MTPVLCRICHRPTGAEFDETNPAQVSLSKLTVCFGCDRPMHTFKRRGTLRFKPSTKREVRATHADA